MTFTRRRRLLAVLCLVIAGAGFCVAAAPKKSKSSQGGWTKIGSFSGSANATGKMLEFRPSMAHWRITINTSVSEKAGPTASAASVRISLMTCSYVGSNDKPFNWEQIERLQAGKPGGTITREMYNGLDKDGTGHWYGIEIAGQSTHYQVTAEETAENDPTSKPSATTEPAAPTKKKKPKGE